MTAALEATSLLTLEEMEVILETTAAIAQGQELEHHQTLALTAMTKETNPRTLMTQMTKTTQA